MHFGATLRLLRVNGGWTLRELAERVGVSNAYLSRVENGHDAPPTPDRLAAIARVLGLPPATLVELADRVGPFTSDYLERVPGARELVMEIVRREFGALEIARVRAFIDREFPVAPETRGMARGLPDMLDPARVIVSMSCSDVEDVIDVAAMKLATATRRSAREIGEALTARERGCTSALGGGLAVPHAILEGIKPAAVVVTLRRGLDVESPDGVPIRLCVVHVHRGGVEHARVLTEMARLAEETTIAAACAERTPARVISELLARRSPERSGGHGTGGAGPRSTALSRARRRLWR